MAFPTAACVHSIEISVNVQITVEVFQVIFLYCKELHLVIWYFETSTPGSASVSSNKHALNRERFSSSIIDMIFFAFATRLSNQIGFDKLKILKTLQPCFSPLNLLCRLFYLHLDHV